MAKLFLDIQIAENGCVLKISDTDFSLSGLKSTSESYFLHNKKDIGNKVQEYLEDNNLLEV